MIKKSLFPPFPTPSSYPEPFQVHLTHVCPQLLRHPLTLGKPESASLIYHRPWAALLGGREGSVQEFSPTLHPRYHRFGRLWELSHPRSALSSCILTKVLLSLSCTHASTASTKANGITRGVSVWAYQQPTQKVSVAVFYSSFSWEMFYHTFCDDPVGNLLIIFQSESQLTSFQNQNVLWKRKVMICFPQFAGTGKGNLENL